MVVPTTLFFDLDKTLCHPRMSFTPMFIASCAPLLNNVPDARVSALLSTWSAALEEPGPSTMAGCLARALAAAGIPAPMHLVEQCARTLTDKWAAAQELDAGVTETLAHLATRYPLGLITNGPSDGQRAVIAALRLHDLFRWCIVSGDEVVGIRKPSAGIFQHALAASGSQPGDTWYTGDSPVNDIAGAAACGWHTCWISPPDAHFPAGLPKPGARIERLDDLLRVIREYE